MTTMPDDESRIFTGTHDDYCWLASTEQYMVDLVQFCPDVVLNRYLVVTKIDSGTPWLTDKQRERGWRLQRGMAYSPPIATVEDLFYQRDGLDAPGFDEWYMFDEPRDLGGILEGNPFLPENAPKPGRLLAFVGWLGFAPGSADPVSQRVQEMFWRQMEWVQPDLYISDGTESLNVVCKDRDLLNSIHQRLSEALAG
jgi:hypothetical protein